MKKWLQRIIQSIADANEREYGNSVPDCCAKGKTEPRPPAKGTKMRYGRKPQDTYRKKRKDV